MIIGIDEVGRGAWAGPLVVAAVGLGGAEIAGLTDSKLLTKKKRERLSREIKLVAPLVGIGWVSARDIDRIGLSAALRLAAYRAVVQLDITSDDHIIIDGTINLLAPLEKTYHATFPKPRSQAPWELKCAITTMKKADMLVPSVSAASVIAKVARDDYMALCDTIFPGYGFVGHVGYGAAKHRAAIEQLGPTPIHRMSFEPLKSQYNNNYYVQNNANTSRRAVLGTPDRAAVSPSHLSIGNHAEDAAANYLQRHGYEIIDRNWKTKWCEVDIIAVRKDIVYFVEVKYRRSHRQGGGIAAITPKKLRQMGFAAKLWLHTHGDHDARLSVIEVTGETFEVTEFIENST